MPRKPKDAPESVAPDSVECGPDTPDPVDSAEPEPRLDECIPLASAIVVKEWPSLVRAMIAKAKKGDVNAFRELRQGIIEPLTKPKDPKRPSQPASIGKALDWVQLPPGEVAVTEVPKEDEPEYPLG